MRERARIRKSEHELAQRRDHVAAEHHEQAEEREQRADEAERRARSAEQEARRARAEAQLHEERASLHEQGLADHELVEDHERERFAGTSAVVDDDHTRFDVGIARDDDAPYANDPRDEPIADREDDVPGSRPARRT
jgi:hypothetical protein